MKKHLFKIAALSALLAAALLLIPQQNNQTADHIILADDAARIAWLNLRGWQVDQPDISEIRLPNAWQTELGQNWLRLQSAQGLHPEQFAGQNATRCLYPIPDDLRPHLFAELLLCDNILVGAQVYDAESGLMQSVR